MAPDGGTDPAAADRALASAAAGGDRAALETLLGKHFDYVHALCRRVTGDPDDAMDATQEALVSVARRIDTYDGRAAFTTWVYRVAVNAALDEVRRRGRRPRPVDEVPDTPARSFEDSVDARLDVDAVLADVPADFRAALVLRELCDLDYAEIAEVLDVPVGTVRSRIARGRAAFADRAKAASTGNPTPGPERPSTEDR